MRLLPDTQHCRILSTSFGNECLISGYACSALAALRSCEASLVQGNVRTKLDVVDGLIVRTTNSPDPSVPLRYNFRVRLPPFETRGKGQIEVAVDIPGHKNIVRICRPIVWDVIESSHVEKFGSGADASSDVVVVLATYNPPANLFETQLRSIAHQTFKCHCVIVDDGSDPESVDRIRLVAAECGNVTLIRSEFNKGFYANFESGLAWVLAHMTPQFIALADQDDRWYSQKLDVLVEELRRSGCSLAFSDMRVTTPCGSVLAETFWQHRTFCLSASALRISNFVTGMTSVFRADLVLRSLPFPALRTAYHDHWLARCAMRSDGIIYYPRALVDYVQHAGNHTGVRRSDASATAVVVHYLGFLISRLLPSRLQSRSVKQAADFVVQAISRISDMALLIRAGEAEKKDLRRWALAALFFGFRDRDTRVLALLMFLLAPHVKVVWSLSDRASTHTKAHF